MDRTGKKGEWLASRKMEQECVNRWLEKEEKNEKKGMKENKIMKFVRKHFFKGIVSGVFYL